MSAAPNEQAELSSSDIALRSRAPYCVANRWRITATYIPEPGEKLKRRFAFLETALRYLVAVLAAEHTARALPEVASWTTLVNSLGHKPIGLGLWRDAARDLSTRVLNASDPVLAPIASILAERPARGRARQAPVCEALERLVRLRNEDAHPDGVPSSNASGLLKETEAPFRAFLSAFRRVGDQAPWVVTRPSFRNGRHEASVVCLRGMDVLPERTLPLSAPIEENQPFIVAEDGRVLYLSPFLVWGEFPDGAGRLRPSELRLFKDWKGGPLYSDPLGMDDARPPAAAVAGTPVEWLGAGLRIVDGCFTSVPDTLRALRRPDGAEPPPSVPGYDLVEPLGFGGNGRVYLARPHRGGEPVAVKVLPQSLTADHAGRSRLRREFETMSRIRSPNVAKVYAYEPDTPSGPALVMELVPGENLRAVVSRAPMPVNEAVRALEGVLAGLSAAHGAGVVHRDVTPENVILEPCGNVKLIDFGIAFDPDGERLTRTLDGMGKRSFAAPEQINPTGGPEPTADVYACGKLLGYLVSGSMKGAEQHAALPGKLQAVVRRATAEDPAERWPDAGALLGALEQARASGWQGAPVQPGDHLSPDYVVTVLGASLGGGLWQVGLLHLPDGAELAGLVAERRPDAEAALRRTLRSLSAESRARLGHPDARENDGLRWCVLRAEDPAEISAVLPGMPGAVRAPPRAAPAVAPSAPAVTAPVAGPASAVPPAPAHPAAAPDSPFAVAVPTPAYSMAPRGKPRWSPPPPAETGEDQSAGTILPPGAFGLFCALFVPAWPILLLRMISLAAGNRAPDEPSEPLPAYLPRLHRFGKIADPHEVARVLDTLALVVAIQRVLRGKEPPDVAALREGYGDPLRIAWPVLTLPPASHLVEHRRVLGGVAYRRTGLSALRTVHTALVTGVVSIPPGSYRRVNTALVQLHRLAHAGARGLPPGDVEAWLARVTDPQRENK